ncbi:unnamed protein product [Prunus armeniaca]
MECGNAQQVTGKGKGKQDNNAWSVEKSTMLLQLMIDAAYRRWRDANGMLSRATVETKILPKINEKCRCHNFAPPFSYTTQTELVLACVGLHNFLRKECRSDEFPVELENESSSYSSLRVIEGDPALVFQTQEQQRHNVNEWRVGIALNIWRDVGHNDNNENQG